jgi:hypothetical protein
MSHGKLEEECESLHDVVDAHEQEKAKAVADREVDIATARKKF